MSDHDLFSVFEEDDSDIMQVPVSESKRSEPKPQKRKALPAFHTNEAPRKKRKISDEKDLITEVAEGTAEAEERKRREMEEAAQETTLIECIHEVAYPPDWGK